MKQLFRIDADGFFIEPVIVKDDAVTDGLIETPILPGLFSPKWDGMQWVEGKSLEETTRLRQEIEVKQNELGEVDILGRTVTELEIKLLELEAKLNV